MGLTLRNTPPPPPSQLLLPALPIVGCRGGQGDLYEQLNYEAIKEQAGMDDSQLVYVSFSNQALAHLPYMVALDETSRSAVLPCTATLLPAPHYCCC